MTIPRNITRDDASPIENFSVIYNNKETKWKDFTASLFEANIKKPANELIIVGKINVEIKKHITDISGLFLDKFRNDEFYAKISLLDKIFVFIFNILSSEKYVQKVCDIGKRIMGEKRTRFIEESALRSLKSPTKEVTAIRTSIYLDDSFGDCFQRFKSLDKLKPDTTSPKVQLAEALPPSILDSAVIKELQPIEPPKTIKVISEERPHSPRDIAAFTIMRPQAELAIPKENNPEVLTVELLKLITEIEDIDIQGTVFKAVNTFKKDNPNTPLKKKKLLQIINQTKRNSVKTKQPTETPSKPAEKASTRQILKGWFNKAKELTERKKDIPLLDIID